MNKKIQFIKEKKILKKRLNLKKVKLININLNLVYKIK